MTRTRSLRARVTRTVAVTAVLGLVATTASYLVVRNDVDRLERQRIDRPATQALLSVQHLMASVDQVLATANGVVAASGLDARRFVAVLGPDVQANPTLAGIALVARTGSVPRVTARTGDTRLLARASDAVVPTASSTLVAARAGRAVYEVGFAALAAHGKAAVYLEVTLPVAASGLPFVLTTGGTHPQAVLGDVASTAGLTRWNQAVSFGGRSLDLYVRAAPGPGGLFGLSLPLLVLIVGLLLTALAIAVGVVIARRDDAVQHLGFENRALDRALEQQRVVEAELRASEERFRTILRDTPDIIVLFDATARTCDVRNRPDFFGHPLEALAVAGGLAALVDDDDRAEADAHWARLARLEPEQVCETTLRLHDATGGIRYARLRFSPLDAGDGSDAPLLLGLVSDVTEAWANETREAELHEALRRSQRLEAVGQLAGGVAHDFNNLLAAILASAELLMDDVPEGRPQEYAIEIQRAATRGAALIRQLLTFAQKDRAESRAVDLNAIVEGMDPLLRRTLGEHVQLQITTTDCSTEVHGDPTHLEQVILNLAVNARDAMPAGGVLWIATAIDFDDDAPQNDRVVLSVTDTGEGIPDDMRERMFDPFVTSKDPGKGTGLGLSTVQSIVAGMDGTIAVQSKLGEGTTFEISLARRFGEVAGSALAVAEPEIDGAGRRILLVEDEQAVRFSVARLLQRQGFAVTTSTNGSEAIQLVEAQTFDLVLTDAVMPGLSGPDLVKHLRLTHPALRVILMSGYTPEAAGDDDGLAGTQRLRKPFTTPDLARALTVAFEREPVATAPVEETLR